MKHMNDDSSHNGVHSNDTSSSAFSGRCLDIDEDSPFSDLSAVYACSDQAQFAALDATSGIFVREVAHYLGLAGSDLTIPYDFAPLAETVRRHCRRKRPRKTSRTSATAGAGADSTDSGQQADACDSGGRQADHETAASVGGQSPTVSTSNRKKDRGAGRRMRREQRDAREHPEPLPDFPAFKPTSTFNGWTHQYAWAEDICEYSTLLGATTSGAYKHITSAMTLMHGLPKFHQRCIDGDFTIEHVAFVTRRCRDVAFRYLPSIDDYLADRRADITIETFKRSLALKIAATQPAQETLEKVAVRRRVDISTGDDGTAYLTLTGPAPELHAYFATPPPQTTGPPPTTPAAGAAPPAATSTSTAPSDAETPPRHKDQQKKSATAEEKPPTAQSQTAQSTTDHAGEDQSPGWAEYVDPFSCQPEQNAKQWFWDSGEQPPF